MYMCELDVVRREFEGEGLEELEDALDALGVFCITEQGVLVVKSQTVQDLTEDEAETLQEELMGLGVPSKIDYVEYEGIEEWAEQEYQEFYRNRI